jgi:hypothetical protein
MNLCFKELLYCCKLYHSYFYCLYNFNCEDGGSRAFRNKAHGVKSGNVIRVMSLSEHRSSWRLCTNFVYKNCFFAKKCTFLLLILSSWVWLYWGVKFWNVNILLNHMAAWVGLLFFSVLIMMDDYCLLIVNHFRINNLFMCQQMRVHSFALQEFVNQFTVHWTVHLLAPMEFVNKFLVRGNNNMTVKFLSTVSPFSANFCLSPFSDINSHKRSFCV